MLYRIRCFQCANKSLQTFCFVLHILFFWIQAISARYFIIFNRFLFFSFLFEIFEQKTKIAFIILWEIIICSLFMLALRVKLLKSVSFLFNHLMCVCVCTFADDGSCRVFFSLFLSQIYCEVTNEHINVH